MKNKFVHIVADYGKDDPAFNEVVQRIYSYMPELKIRTTSVPAFDTIGTGFWIYQYAMGQHPEGMVIYSNTAPRKDNKHAREKNEGERLMYGKTENGIEIMAVNAGYCFSFIKPYLKLFRVVKIPNKGSQFRSRDFYPKALAKLLTNEAVLSEEIDTKLIIDPPVSKIAWIDGYGNIKTTIRRSDVDYQAGDKLHVMINKVRRTALIAGGNFSVSDGELSFSPGSSGYDDPFMELFLRGGSAEKLFEFPKSGVKVMLGSRMSS